MTHPVDEMFVDVVVVSVVVSVFVVVGGVVVDPKNLPLKLG